MYKEIDELVKKAKAGDEYSKERLLKLYKPLILTQMKRYYFDINEYDDLIQEGYEVVLRGISQFDYSKNVYFSGYLNTILRYHYLDRLKAKKHMASLDKDIFEEGGSLLDLLEADTDIENEFIARELNDKLSNTINHLSNRQREVILLFYIRNMNMYDIAKKLEISYRTVVNTKVKAIEKLKNLI